MLALLDPLLPVGFADLSTSLRAALCASAVFAAAWVFGARCIAWLAARFREPIKGDSARLAAIQSSKRATPTMGGLFIVAGILGGMLAFGDLENAHLQAALVLTVGLGALGAIDDWTKLFTRANGLSARRKLLGQVVVALAAATIVWRSHAGVPGALELQWPWGQSLPLGAWFLPLAVLVIVGFSNSVNLTDGLDGLAGGCLAFSTAAMVLVVCLAGNAGLAARFGLIHIPGCGELAVLGGGMLGALLGFLRFNRHPARVFMGDSGSLPLGGLLGLLGVAARQELLLMLVGGVFVAEAASVVLQVGYYKWRRRRIFRCAPLHHHFQFGGWPEQTIVVRGWIAAALCALVALASLVP
jgi:phospho-N-acetylmuramoyl-pentapeptide-transferase